jgi:septum formation protein
MNQTKPFVLASNSPRRTFLLRECGFHFRVLPTHASEEFDPAMKAELVPSFLARKKAEAALQSIQTSQLIVTADTVVIFNGEILNKPQSEAEAIEMLSKLSGQTHKVITGVCLANSSEIEVMEEISQVTFNPLSLSDIKNYVAQFKPMDKAGAYGAQECLPPNYDPCSDDERNFLARIGNHSIIEKSKPEHSPAKPIVAIKQITGSYFNVMGLPIATLYPKIIAKL